MTYYPPPAVPESFQACVVAAEQKYQVPRCILHAVHQVESGGRLRPGLVSNNTNGTKDYSVMQINTVWMKNFQRDFGLRPEEFTENACLAVNGAAYILRYEINQAGGDFWRGVGNYHSRTPKFHDPYVEKVAKQAQRYGCQIK